MRLALLLFGLLLLPAFAGAAGETVVKTYTGTSTRDPLLGPHPICDVAGTNIGGACFDLPAGSGAVQIRVDERVSLGRQVVVVSFYTSTIGLPIDGVTYCPSKGETWTFGTRGATRLALSVAPADITGLDCIAGPGTGGTITFRAI